MNPHRRRLMAAALAFPGVPYRAPPVDDSALVFPRDFGAHPEFSTEWWYLTGWLNARTGVQITYFRVRTRHPESNPNRLAPKELLIAHAALMSDARGTPLHAQRAERSGSPRVECARDDTRLRLGGWTMQREGAVGHDRYLIHIDDPSFRLELETIADSPPWLQGDAGFSRKGPDLLQASRYYSRPWLRIEGSASIDGKAIPIEDGRAWFDHEWSTSVLDARAQGWDWVGLNLDDGSALVAFRIRSNNGEAPIWTYAALRQRDGRVRRLGIDFAATRHWRSARTRIQYPVAMRLTGMDEGPIDLVPLMDDQELDMQLSTGTVYWEGAVRVERGGRRIGLGYLELTGYGSAMRL